MYFPTIYTNIWDVLIAVPLILILTQIIKMIFKIKPVFVPTVPVVLGLLLAIFVSHKYDLLAGIFMGFFYGYSAIGNYASFKTAFNAYKKRKLKKSATYNYKINP
ncbi:hypothetical protein [Ureibacillus manganicus]|uniref:Holin n=1 Tax=Ureibacillus manganicus DSM 26584 TaxID=1384049 RepID=A0A0A3HQN0_9BACL|nr:hypothetical protein [Ureibacillus manganicus]KGR73535.1 hypothetical protein CD29_19830 [Ureibacillus manganicus DSM 26584]